MTKAKKDKSQEAVKKAIEKHEAQEADKAKTTKKARTTKKKTTKKVTKKAPAKKKMGRPSKYKPEYCETLMENMGEGLSFEACCGLIGIDKTTGYEWTKKFPDFSNAKKRGEALSQLWWEQQGKKGMFWGKDFNGVVWVFAMKNRFDWRDNKDLNLGGQPGNPIQAQGPLGAILDELDTMDDADLDTEIEKILERRKNS